LLRSYSSRGSFPCTVFTVRLPHANHRTKLSTAPFRATFTTMTVTEQARALKEQGNKAFKEHDWAAAVSFYTQAIDLCDDEASFYANRAQVSTLSSHAIPYSTRQSSHTLPTRHDTNRNLRCTQIPSLVMPKQKVIAQAVVEWVAAITESSGVPHTCCVAQLLTHDGT
jgi:hypothetical protein